MLLIVGLGNPGKKYENTRHNLGFMVLDNFAETVKAKFGLSTKFESDLAEATLTFPGKKKHVRVLLAKPQTFMNNSGRAVARLVSFYKLRVSDQVWVVHDDIDIDLGKTRVRVNGSSAGQKGVQSIIDSLGTDRFIRFRIGIRPEGRQIKSVEKFVLKGFLPEEQSLIQQAIDEAVRGLVLSCDRGVINTSL